MLSTISSLLLLAPLPVHDEVWERIEAITSTLNQEEDANLLVQRARLLLQIGEPQEALADLKRAARLAPTGVGLEDMAGLRWRIEQAVQAATREPSAQNFGPRQGGNTVLVPTGASWRYLDDGTNQGSTWRDPMFDDSSWPSGSAQLGYGDGDEATVVSFGPNPNDKYITTYFRHSFVVADASLYAALELRLLRDDGAVVYLNGVEIARSNLPAGNVGFMTRALSAISGSSEDTFCPIFLESGALQTGTNVLAVEIHQVSPTSSDISLDLELSAFSDTRLVRGPYLQMGSDSRMTLRWRTVPASDGRVAYGPAPGQLTNLVDDFVMQEEHEIELQGLQPDAQYYYSVGTTGGVVFAGDDPEHSFFTAPTTGTARPTRVWIIGDSGTADASARAVRDAYANFTGVDPTHLWLMLGDNAYQSGSLEEYQKAVFDMYPNMLRSAPLWPTRGNHETFAGVYFDLFTLPTAGEAGGVPSGSEAYYSFDYGNVHFVCLNSFGSDRSVGAPMYTWLEADLAATDAEWLIAFWHHPPYSKGSHDSDTESTLIEMRQNFLPLLEEHGVDLVLTGHSHSYERSFLIDGHYGLSGSFDDQNKVDGGDGRPAQDGAYNKADGAHGGTVYCVAGCSGKTSNGPLNHPAMIHSVSALGSVVLDIQEGRLDAKFIRGNGVIWDWFTIHSEQYFGEYCAPSPTAQGCVAEIEWSGSPSVSSGQPFLIDALNVRTSQYGMLFYGFGPTNRPFQGSRLCVTSPLRKTAPQQATGIQFPCEGRYSYDFNALIQSGSDSDLVAGATVYSQYWFRDPMGVTGSSTSQALQFTIEP